MGRLLEESRQILLRLLREQAEVRVYSDQKLQVDRLYINYTEMLECNGIAHIVYATSLVTCQKLFFAPKIFFFFLFFGEVHYVKFHNQRKRV